MISKEELVTWDTGSLQAYLQNLKWKQEEVAGAIAEVELLLSLEDNKPPMTWAEIAGYGQ
jgi:hypothetical protein